MINWVELLGVREKNSVATVAVSICVWVWVGVFESLCKILLC